MLCIDGLLQLDTAGDWASSRDHGNKSDITGHTGEAGRLQKKDLEGKGNKKVDAARR